MLKEMVKQTDLKLSTSKQTLLKQISTQYLVFFRLFDAFIINFDFFFVVVGLWSQTADKLTIYSIPCSWIL
jgi:hypothetical protein